MAADGTIRIEIPAGQSPDFNKVKRSLELDAQDRVQRIPGTQQFDITLHRSRHRVAVEERIRRAGYQIVRQEAAANPEPTGVVARHPELKRKPFAMHPMPESFSVRKPIWHDGSVTADPDEGKERLVSGELRIEMKTLTPLLVGWERSTVADAVSRQEVRVSGTEPSERDELEQVLQAAALQECPVPVQDPAEDAQKYNAKVARAARKRAELVESHRQNARRLSLPSGEVGWVSQEKAMLAPVRLPWLPGRPVMIPADSIHGCIRHYHAALVGSPMERVAERVYSYRANMRFPMEATGRRLEPRLALVKSSKEETDADGRSWRVPKTVDVYEFLTRDDGSQTYYPRWNRHLPPPVLQPPGTGEQPYKGGMAAGEKLPRKVLSPDAQKRLIHTHLQVNGTIAHSAIGIDDDAVRGYMRTVAHYLDELHGHFSNRHPQVGKDDAARKEAIDAVSQGAKKRAFQNGDLIWVEWDKDNNRITSFGWHYYYRWAYTDSVRTKRGKARDGLHPLVEELQSSDKLLLTSTRRLFGFTADDQNPGVKGVGGKDTPQLMGRLFPNNALEVVAEGETDQARFLAPTFLRELGEPKPSAVEHYLHQDGRRTSDRATLRTYGDVDGIDEGGELAGRKFYLDRRDAYPPEGSVLEQWTAWADPSASNRLNKLSTLALDASRPGRTYRFVVRFRDLTPCELAEVMLAMAPNQFAARAGGTHGDGYCAKLGYARPLGWGSVQMQVKELRFLCDAADRKAAQRSSDEDERTEAGQSVSAAFSLDPATNVEEWFAARFDPAQYPALQSWLSIVRCKHPDASDYPREGGEIYNYHTRLRGEHAKLRRMKR